MSTPWKQAAKARPLVTYVPESALESVRKHGLLSGSAIINNQEALASAAAARGETPEDFKKSVEGVLAGWKPTSAQGVNAAFAPPPQTTQLAANHPFNRWKLVPLHVDLDALLKDEPTTRLHGSELTPYNEKDDERLGDSYADIRHRDLTSEEVAALRQSSPEDLWKHYADPDNKGYYAPDVPHVSVITPNGSIPWKYIKSAATNTGDLTKLKGDMIYDYVAQEHDAHRAGKHTDLRFGDKDTGLYSWAVRKGIPEQGQKQLAVQQPLHPHSYGTFQGLIPEGFPGAGSVSIQDSGKIKLHKILPGEIHFGREGSDQKFLLKQTDGKNWIFINTSPKPA